MHQAIKQEVWDEVLAPQALGVGTDSGDILDMEGYIGVEFIVPVTDCLNGGVVTLQAQQNDVNSPAGMANLVGDASDTSAGDDDLNDQLLVLDVYKPTKRYLRPQVVRATANVAIGNVIARRYRARKEPTSQGSTVLDSNGLVSPAEA